MRDEEIIILIGTVFGLFIMLALQAGLCFFWQTCLNSVDEEHRTMSPGLAWLYMVPCLNIFWLFYLMINIPKSFQQHFEARNITDVGDCGQGICIAFAICALLSSIPYVNCLTSIPTLVLLIIHIVKFNELKNKASA